MFKIGIAFVVLLELGSILLLVLAVLDLCLHDGARVTRLALAASVTSLVGVQLIKELRSWR